MEEMVIWVSTSCGKIVSCLSSGPTEVGAHNSTDFGGPDYHSIYNDRPRAHLAYVSDEPSHHVPCPNNVVEWSFACLVHGSAIRQVSNLLTCVVKILKQNAVAVSEHQKTSGLNELEANVTKTIPSAKLLPASFKIDVLSFLVQKCPQFITSSIVGEEEVRINILQGEADWCWLLELTGAGYWPQNAHIRLQYPP